MNKLEAAQLLTIASGFDRFIVADEITTTAWTLALATVPFTVGQQAVVDHYTGKNGRRSISVRDILDAVEARGRTRQHQIDADVRSAKARGLVSRDWPMHQQLPTGVAAALAEARERDREAAGDYLEVEA